MHLHYPATDLPQKTRDQIKTEHVRTLANGKAGHADIITYNKHELPASAVNLGVCDV